MDIRDAHGVKTNKLSGSRVEYNPFPGGFKIIPGYTHTVCPLPVDRAISRGCIWLISEFVLDVL